MNEMINEKPKGRIACTVGEIAATPKNSLVGGPFGSNLVSADYVEHGIPVIRGQNMGLGRWVEGDFAFVSPEKAESLSANIAKPGDLVFTQRGTLGQVAIVPEKQYDKYVISQSQMKLTVDTEKANTLFLYYYFSSNEQQEYIKSNSIQTGVPHTNLGFLRETPLLLPPIPEQRAIARILGAIDDKIEANCRMNETLEAIACAIFKSWFVDFDPVRAKAEGQEPAGMDAETAALFPDSFEETEMGMVPKGWKLKSLDEIADFLNGLAMQKFPPESEDFLPVIKIAELHRGNTIGSDRASSNIDPRYIIEDGDLLFSWSGSLEVCIWCGGEGALNQHLFKVTSTEYPMWFLYFWLKEHLPEFQLIAAGKATTMGHIQRYHLSEAKAAIPIASLIERVDVIIKPLLELVIINNLESRNLSSIRDSLLQKLLLGEIQVSDIEKSLEDSPLKEKLATC